MAKQNKIVHEDCFAYIEDNTKTGCAALAVQKCDSCRFYTPKQEQQSDTQQLVNSYKNDLQSGKFKRSGNDENKSEDTSE